MILRELIARMTLDMDRGAFDKADRRVSGLKRGLEFAGQAAIALGAALGVGVGFMVNRAADANETLNLMGIVFEDNRQAVVDWADAVSEATGRSVFDLREGVTVLGNALKGMTGDLEASTEMAQNLAERAVDFGSALNVSLEGSEGAINKFLSALAGETEPLRRFGINMTVAALDAFALEQGIGKTVAKMDEAEKAQLRYSFLMAKTSEFQGDAANTSEAFANSSRALLAALGDLGTRIGLKFLPAAEGIVRGARNVVQSISKWIEKSSILQAAMITFGSIATAIGVRVAVTWAAANLPIVLAALALAALVLIVDDFLTFLQGGDSIIGAWIDSMWGPGSAAEAAMQLRAVLDDLGYFWTNILAPAVSEAVDGMLLAVQDLVARFENEFVPAVEGVVDSVRGAWNDFFEWWKSGIAAVADALGISKDTLSEWAKFVRDTLSSTVDFVAKALARGFGIELASDALEDIAESWKQIGGNNAPRAAERGIGGRTFADVGDTPPDPTAAGWAMFTPNSQTPTIPVPAGAQTRNDNRSNQTINQTVEVTVPPGTERGMARDVATSTGEELRRMNRHARAGLSQRAEGG